MLVLGQGVDIVNEIGGISDLQTARTLLTEKMDAANAQKLEKICSEKVLIKLANSARMCRPAAVFINSGTADDRQTVRQLALEKGEEKALALKDHTIHFDLKEEQGRIIDRTYYIADPGVQVSSLANQQPRPEALAEIREKMTGIMDGMTMIVGFYLRGAVGAPVSNPAVEITSSAYVAHSADLLYRNIFDSFDKEAQRLGHVYVNIHSEGPNRPEDLPNARVYMDRSHQTTYSIFCTYAGNTLLLKKGNHRFSVDKAVYLNAPDELSEHMFITGVNGPDGRVTWFTGAAPSGCGKTTTAMAGDHFVGDDLAQLWRAEDGSIRSVNPEAGIFGIVEDVNWEGDPRLMECLRNEGTEVIWSNVLITPDGVPQWTGNQEPTPEKGFNFQGDWTAEMLKQEKPVPVSHPNARCTLRASALSNFSQQGESAGGVETRVITYSGRDSDTMPPVWVGKNADHGVVIGATIVSAATATEVGATGVKRSPWANAPFIPGALGDYMKAQFDFFNHSGISAEKAPIMAGLNYFLTDVARGGAHKTLLGEKRDVRAWLAWLERRVHGEVGAIETPIGFLPYYADLKRLFKEIIDKDYPEALYVRQFSLYIDNIIARIDLQREAYSKEDNIPEPLFKVLEEQKEGLNALKAKFGPVVTPDQAKGAA